MCQGVRPLHGGRNVCAVRLMQGDDMCQGVRPLLGGRNV